ncbi:hypothetical protein CCP4SC76_5050002 [Gammaproteobacteria bacterium]
MLKNEQKSSPRTEWRLEHWHHQAEAIAGNPAIGGERASHRLATNFVWSGDVNIVSVVLSTGVFRIYLIFFNSCSRRELTFMDFSRSSL